MESSDKRELERLRLELESSEAATVAWRELLIESLGDRLCGSGAGPTPDDIDTLAALEEARHRASENYAAFLLSVSLRRGERANGT